ncbi:MAG: outer membrane beta-barrel protein [Mariprofundaceae bacterium]|nr:outer membrane beta-barrel protein [Mariprofundaceae bacterium]
MIGIALFSAHVKAAASTKLESLYSTSFLKISEVYNDNIINQEKRKTSSWISIIDPSFSIKGEKGISQVKATYRLSKGIYQSSSNDNYLDHFTGVSVGFDLSTRLQTRFSFNYNKKHDPRGSIFTGKTISIKTPDQYHETIVDGNIGYGVNAHIDVKGEYSNKYYDNNRLITSARDFDATAGSTAFSYPVGSKTKAVLEVRYKRFNYKTANLDSNEQRYFVGADWEATAKTSGTLRLGYLKKSFTNAALTNTSQFSWELNMDWQPTTYSRLTLATNSKPHESDGRGSFTKTTGSTLTWNYAWSSHLNHAVYVGYSNNQYQDVTMPITYTFMVVGASVNYQLQRWLGIQTAYDYRNRNSNQVNSSYTGNIWTLSFVAAL